MSEYTPTTEEIREYIRAADRVAAHMFSDASPDAVEAFDRWLAAHDAEVRSGVVAEEPRPLTVECPHWSPGRITLRAGCTACAGEGRVPVKQEGAGDAEA